MRLFPMLSQTLPWLQYVAYLGFLKGRKITLVTTSGVIWGGLGGRRPQGKRKRERKKEKKKKEKKKKKKRKKKEGNYE